MSTGALEPYKNGLGKLDWPAACSVHFPPIAPLLEPGGASLVDRSPGTIQTGLEKLDRPAGYSQPSPLVPPLLEPGGASLVDRSTGTIQTGLEKPVRLAVYSEFPQLPSS